MNIVLTLQALVPGCEFSINGEFPINASEYAERVAWISPQNQQPSWDAVVAAWPAIDSAVRNEEARRHRLVAFRDEADPLFFGWQRGENTEQAWLDKCEEIRQRFPYVTA